MSDRPGLTIRQQSNAVAAIQVGSLMDMLQKHALAGNRSKMSATRIRAAEVLLARAVPTLSAVDQTLHQPDDALTEEQIFEKMAALMAAHPDIFQRLLAAQARAKPGIETVADIPNGAPLQPSDLDIEQDDTAQAIERYQLLRCSGA